MAEPRLYAEVIATHLAITKDDVCDRVADNAMPASCVGGLWMVHENENDEPVRSGKVAPEFVVDDGI